MHVFNSISSGLKKYLSFVDSTNKSVSVKLKLKCFCDFVCLICDCNILRVAGPNNPYKKFFMRPADRAAIWRVLPPLKLEEMDMTQKSEYITELVNNYIVLNVLLCYKSIIII